MKSEAKYLSSNPTQLWSQLPPYARMQKCNGWIVKNCRSQHIFLKKKLRKKICHLLFMKGTAEKRSIGETHTGKSSV